MRSGHSFPPLRAGLNIYLTLYLVPEASGALHLDHSDTIHGSGTAKKYRKYHQHTLKFITRIYNQKVYCFECVEK